jgi:hypothetical protein
MKRIIFLVLVLLAAIYAAWPYAYLHRIDTALTRDDQMTLAKLIDIDAVRAAVEHAMTRDVDTALGTRTDGFVGWLRTQVNELGHAAVEEIIDMEWVTETLKPGPESFRSHITHTSFESWSDFLIRHGELGDNPVHVRLKLTAGNWKVVAIYP